uniref:Coiled-coil domain-containing protein 69 n=1 Tax=Caenorhabditis tropicalis TaxID=1561998 RepID=A0A1I7UG28_9PELO
MPSKKKSGRFANQTGIRKTAPRKAKMLNNSKKTQGKKLASKVTVPKSPPREPTAEESAEMERISERIKEMESEIHVQKEPNAKLFEEIEKEALESKETLSKLKSYQDDHNRVLDSITDEKTEMLEEIEQIHQTIQGCRELEMHESMGNQYEQLTKEKDSLANAPFPWQKCGACQNQYSQEEEDRTPRTLGLFLYSFLSMWTCDMSWMCQAFTKTKSSVPLMKWSASLVVDRLQHN